MSLQKLRGERERETASAKERSLGEKVKGVFLKTKEEAAAERFEKKYSAAQPKIASPEKIVDLGDDGKINKSGGSGNITINVGGTSPQEQVQVTPPQPPEKKTFASKLKSIGSGIRGGAGGFMDFAQKYGQSDPLGYNKGMMGNANMRDPLAGLQGGGYGRDPLAGIIGVGGGRGDPLAGLMRGSGGRRGDPLAGLSGGYRPRGNPLAVLNSGGRRKRCGDPLAGLCGGFGGGRGKDPLKMLMGATGVKRRVKKKKKRRRY
jgi:hypothetical protein